MCWNVCVRIVKLTYIKYIATIERQAMLNIFPKIKTKYIFVYIREMGGEDPRAFNEDENLQ